jgi:hypothetical protein
LKSDDAPLIATRDKSKGVPGFAQE